MKRTIASVPLLLVALALAACAPTPPPGATPVDPRPTPPSTATPIPVPTATLPPEDLDPLDAVTRILLETERVSFCDDTTCAIDGFDFADDAHEVAAAKLAAVFGADPIVERWDPEEGGEAVYYTWDAFRLSYVVGEGLIGSSLGVTVEAPAAYGVAVETVHGIRVGTPLSEARAHADLVVTDFGEYEMHFDSVPDPVYPWDFYVGGFGAVDGSGAVLSLTAPLAWSAE